MIREIVLPELGATGGDSRIVEWLVGVGDTVVTGQPIFSVETDKALVEVEAFRGGFLRKILVGPDTQVAPGTPVALLADSLDEDLTQTPEAPARPVAERETRPPGRVKAAIPPGGKQILASPLSRVVAGKLGVDLVRVKGTGLEGRIRKCDVEQAAALGPSPSPPESRLLDMFRYMVLIRRYEDHLYQLFLQGLVPGTLHQCQGQEATAVGVCFALRRTDAVLSTHRPVGHLIAKGASLNAITAEIWGKVSGCAGGKGGQMHLSDLSVTVPPSNAIVGANIPIATGMALGYKLRGTDSVAVSFFGDGASNIGAFHEGLNLAAVKNAPVVFVCENNLYGASTHISKAILLDDIAERAHSYGMPGVVVDGMDVEAVHQAAAKAVARARSGNGPTLLETKTYRYSGHSRGDPCGYRDEEEVALWQKRDPVVLCRGLLVDEYGVTEAVLDRIGQECQSQVEDAVAFAQAEPDPERHTCFEHVFKV